MTFGSNQFLSGGLALGGIAAAAAITRHYLMLALRTLRQRYVAEVEVRDTSMVYWLGIWLAHTDYGKRCRRVTSEVRYQDGGDGPPTLTFAPGPGLHIFRHAGRWIIVNRIQEKSDTSLAIREWFNFKVVGPREAALQFLEDAKTFALELLSRRHTAFISDGRGDWNRVGVGVPRKLSSVVLPGTTALDVATRAREFLASRAWYVERGIPWRLGFGFFGPPRTGKTSLVRAVTNELGLPLYVLDLTSKEFCDRDLVMTLSRLPIGAALLIEDIDTQLGAKSSFVTLSGLLNALDGPLATEGRILFVTSNVPDKLDAALLGEGRLDVHVHIGYATREQVREMFLKFFPADDHRADTFAAAIPDQTLPLAAVQEFLLVRSADADRAIAEAHILARREVREVKREAA